MVDIEGDNSQSGSESTQRFSAETAAVDRISLSVTCQSEEQSRGNIPTIHVQSAIDLTMIKIDCVLQHVNIEHVGLCIYNTNFWIWRRFPFQVLQTLLLFLLLL